MRQIGKINRLNDDIHIEKHSIEYDKYDLHTFRDIIETNPRIKQTSVEGEKDYKQFPELHQDLFDALFKYEPKKIPEGRVKHEYALNSQVMDIILESPKYKELRNSTRLDKVISTIGTEVMGDEVKEFVKKLQEEFQKAIEEAEKLAQKVQKAKGKADDGSEGTKGKGQAEIEFKKAQELLEEHMKKVHNFIDKKERRELNKIVEKASNEAIESSNMITNWGLDRDPNYIRSGYQDKLALLDRLRNSKKLKQIAELTGRYRAMAITAQKEKIKRGVDEIYDIVTGDELGKILPFELLRLTHPTLHRVFKKDYLEKRLLQYEYGGRIKKQRGAIIACLDSSGSMSGQPEIWSKAVAMGLLEIARIQNRPLYVIHFDSGDKQHLHVNSFPRKKTHNVTEILDMAEYFANGGTNFEPPLDLAKDKISEDLEFLKADIIFITDGEAAVRDTWAKKYQKWKNEKNVKVYSVLIDVSYNSDICLKLFSDKIYKLSTIRQDSADDLALTLFTSV